MGRFYRVALLWMPVDLQTEEAVSQAQEPDRFEAVSGFLWITPVESEALYGLEAKSRLWKPKQFRITRKSRVETSSEVCCKLC